MVRIHPIGAPSQALPFGDYAGDGKWIGDALRQALAEYKLEPDDEAEELAVAFEGHIAETARTTTGATYRMTFPINRFSIHDSTGNHAYDVNPGDQGRARVGVLFSLPANRDVGQLLMHVPGNRGIKTGLEGHLRRRVREIADVILEIDARVDQSILRSALEVNGLDKVILKKFSPTNADEFERNVGAFGGVEEVGSVELHVNAKRGPRHLIPTRVSSFLDDPTNAAWESLVTFEGLKFDDVRVEAKHPVTNRRKVWTIKGPAGGHPVQQDLDVEDDDSLGLLPLTLENVLLETLENI